jgi:hypothetical protein
MSKEPGQLLFETTRARAGWTETWREVEDKKNVAAVESAIRADESALLQAEADRLREALREYVNTVAEMEGVTFVDQMKNAELRLVIESNLSGED